MTPVSEVARSPLLLLEPALWWLAWVLLLHGVAMSVSLCHHFAYRGPFPESWQYVCTDCAASQYHTSSGRRMEINIALTDKHGTVIVVFEDLPSPTSEDRARVGWYRLHSRLIRV